MSFLANKNTEDVIFDDVRVQLSNDDEMKFNDVFGQVYVSNLNCPKFGLQTLGDENKFIAKRFWSFYLTSSNLV